MILVCGSNKENVLGEESNNKSTSNTDVISPPLRLYFDISSINAYSIYDERAIMTIIDGTARAIGDFSYFKKRPTLPNKKYATFTEFEIKDKQNRSCVPISVVFGCEYALFLVSNPENQSQSQLAFFQEYSNSFTFLNTGELNPVAIFGGADHAAAITEDGGIIFIHDSVFEDNSPLPQEQVFLGGEKAISIACCDNFIIALSISGKVFRSQSSFKLSFLEVYELKGIEIIGISGFDGHCFAVSKDKRVFVLGSNSSGALGLGQKEGNVSMFTEVKSLNKYKINAAYAGSAHSLFQTEEGKILACGDNKYGQLFTNAPCKEEICEPIETTINSGAAFCIASCNSSIAFIDTVPPNIANKALKSNIDTTSVSSQKVETETQQINSDQSEIQLLKDELSHLRSENESLRQQIKTSSEKSQNTEKEAQDSSNKIQENDIQKLNQKISDLQQQLSNFIVHFEGQQNQNFEIYDSDSFQYINTLGNGLIGMSCEVTMKDNKNAIRVLKALGQISPENVLNFIRECIQLNKHNHPNINKIYGAFLGDENIPPSILLHRCPHNIETLIENKMISKADSVCIIYEIAEGMRYAHLLKISHRNLKPSNIFISSDFHVKISDFGIDKLMLPKDQLSKINVEDTKIFFFIAPEMMNDENCNGKADVYSFGALMYFILNSGVIPQLSVYDYINGKQYTVPDTFTNFSKELISACMNKDPSLRPDFETICSKISLHMNDILEVTENEKQEIWLKMIKIKEGII